MTEQTMNRFPCKSFSLAAVLFLCLIMGSGCMVGPNYIKPATEMPKTWVEKSQEISTETPSDLAHWWTVFKDQTLDSLIEQSIKANKDLKIAQARIREARAFRSVAVSGLFPTLEANASYRHQRESFNTSRFEIPSEFIPSGTFTEGIDLFQGGFDALWELDFFGRTRRSIEAGTADVAASVEDLRDTLVTLLSEVAVNYMTVRGAQLRLAIAKKNIEAQSETLKLTEVQLRAGLTSELDVAQARAQLETTESQVPIIETRLKQAIYQLATLLGTTPEPVVEQLTMHEPLPDPPPGVPVGLPSDLLRRRPDVRRAERQLAAATARIGEATADLFPRFTLTGELGQASTDLSKIAKSSSTFWSLGPTILWNVFNAGRTRANIEVQKARAEQALWVYEKTVLNSIQDVESALVAYLKEQERRESLMKAVSSNQRAVDISNALYTRGLVDFLRVLDSQRSLYVTEEQLALSTEQVNSNLIRLYKALGGGWEVR